MIQFKEAGTTSDNLQTRRPLAWHFLENIEHVAKNVQEDPETSTKRRA